MSNSLKKNAIYKTILTICNIVIPIIVMPYVLRILDRNAYEVYNKINTNLQVFITIGAFGIYNYGIREIAKVRDNKEECNKLFTQLFLFSVIVNIVVSLGCILFVFFMSKDNLESMIYYILMLQFLFNIFNVEWINEAKENYRFITIKSIVVKFIYLISNFLLIRNPNDIGYYALIFVGMQLINSFITFIYLKKDIKFTVKNLNFAKHLVPLLIMFLVVNVNMLYTLSDKLMLGNLIAESELTRYQISHTLTGMIYSLFISIALVAIPRFTHLLHQNSKDEYFALFKKVVRIFYMFFLPAVVGLIMLGKEVIVLYGSEKYLDCINTFVLFGIAQLFLSGTYLLGDAMMFVNGRERMLLFVNLIGGVINIGSNFILYLLGVFTAEIAILTLILSYIVIIFVLYLFCKKKLEYKLKVLNKNMILYCVSSLTFVPIIIGIRLIGLNSLVTCLISIPICLCVYFALLLVLKDSIFIDQLKGIILKFKKKNKNL